MNLTEYQRICNGVGAVCAWGPLSDGVDLLEMVAALDAPLLAEIEARGEELKTDCKALIADYTEKGLRRSGTFRAVVEGYRQYLTAYQRIPALVDDLKGGEGNLSDDVRKALISALNGLYGHCMILSGFCLDELDNLQSGREGAPVQEGQTLPQMIEANRDARTLANKLREGGYIDTEIKPTEGITVYERGIAGQALAKALKVPQRVIEDYWGIGEHQISRDASAGRALEGDPRITAILAIVIK